MREALADPELLGGTMVGPSWAPWKALLIAMMGEPLTGNERVLFSQLTGRDVEPLERVEEFWGIIGRRGGKSRAMSVLAAYLAGCVDHSENLAMGERGKLPILAATTLQARICFGYIAAIFTHIRDFASLVSNRTAETLSLSNNVDIEVRPASYRTVRSMTAIAAIGDEAAFWHSDESANPDTEILTALRPALATTGGPLIVISSPYARRGEVYHTWKRHYGQDGDPLILVARGASRQLNPLLSQKVVDRALEKDPSAGAAEYLAEFRSDVETLLTMEAVDAVTIAKRHELPPLEDVQYYAFADPSGSGADSYTFAIAHNERGVSVLDLIRETRPPFSPDATTAAYAELCKTYRVKQVVQDRYGLEWTKERWRAHGIEPVESRDTASEILANLLPMINSGQVELLDHARLRQQLVTLQRSTTKTGRDTVSHPPGGHDDIAVSAAGALWRARRAATGPRVPIAMPVIVFGNGIGAPGASPGRAYLP